ncbi:probable very-long-chain enoyl-CoA reductase art-1 [Ostrinia furnacalis]|uniref:probable very-long-chain enoyl-CoA reductase art-1 n=1 Tax=Ostrinia furnacalis TaxID=93504 RepID=UPI00103DB070|nr:probable very-long-chain enoyl-CoA reductase art-1 [Ostrinia furnacalis]
MEIEILSVAGSKPLGKIQLKEDATVKDVKDKIHRSIKKFLYPDRQAIKLEAKGKALNDEDSLKSLNVQNGAKLYLKDLGPQIAWKNVFLAEYAGPLLVYLWVYQRPWLVYGAQNSSPGAVANVAALCWTGHYAKRLLETLFVHRFSHGTMPLSNLFKNCGYYWMFTLYVAYHVNHPLYTPPSDTWFYVGLTGFVLCELGNLSIHILLKNLRPPGTKVRRIPVPDGNPLTQLFNFVSCPNYTYEFGSWLFFTIMTKCAPAGLFAAAGFYQMAVWALGKHRNYKKEFPEYPKGRKAILPFIL